LLSLPPTLEAKIGQPLKISRDDVRGELASLNLTEATADGSFDTPISQCRSRAVGAPSARYFVIHDTSAPNFRNQPFPTDI
jgi:hypothetical protein